MLHNTFLSATALGLLATVNAHMTMNTPKPYAASTLQSSPLNGANFQFPCSQNSFDASEASQMEVGQPQTLSFTGSAVHGGGSCQLSVTYEYPPPADKSKWKVIHTMIGGCPSTAAGNVQGAGSDADGRPDGTQCAPGQSGECVRSYEFTLPTGLKNGQATLAWTWFNKIGNREMYMNCAPIEISGGSEDESFISSLPEMFVANIPGECTTEPGVLDIPNPGQSVEQGEAPDPAAIGSCGSGTDSGSENGSVPEGDSGDSSSPAPTQSNPGGVFAPGASSSAAPESTSFTTIVMTTTANAPASDPTPPSSGDDSSNSGDDSSNSGNNTSPSTPTDGASTVSCDNDGAVVCVGETKFGLCNRGVAVVQDLAAGMVCSNGTIGAAQAVKRRHVHGRVHRRQAGRMYSS